MKHAQALNIITLELTAITARLEEIRNAIGQEVQAFAGELAPSDHRRLAAERPLVRLEAARRDIGRATENIIHAQGAHVAPALAAEESLVGPEDPLQ